MKIENDDKKKSKITIPSNDTNVSVLGKGHFNDILENL